MKMATGFSLAEVLVSLFLVTGTALALLNTQWQMSQSLNQIRLRSDALVYLDNASERIQAGYPAPSLPKPFHVTTTKSHCGTGLQLVWTCPRSTDKHACTLSRQLNLA